MNEIEELKDTIEMLKQEIKAIQEQQENNYRLINDRLDNLLIKLNKKDIIYT